MDILGSQLDILGKMRISFLSNWQAKKKAEKIIDLTKVKGLLDEARAELSSSSKSISTQTVLSVTPPKKEIAHDEAAFAAVEACVEIYLDESNWTSWGVICRPAV